MRHFHDRRRFLQRTALAGGSLLATGMPSARIDVPVVEELTIREITDNSHDIFLGAQQSAGAGAR